MIIVDIIVESLDNTFDFKLDDDVVISKIIEDICEVLSQKEKCKPAIHTETLILCKYSSGYILPQNMTLRDCGIVSGDKLMLV